VFEVRGTFPVGSEILNTGEMLRMMEAELKMWEGRWKTRCQPPLLSFSTEDISRPGTSLSI
jgi:hypothetical protein